MMSPHPGAFLRVEILDQRRLNVSRVAEILDERRAIVSSLLNEQAARSAEMALRWEKALGVNMGRMLRMQAAYDTPGRRAAPATGECSDGLPLPSTPAPARAARKDRHQAI